MTYAGFLQRLSGGLIDGIIFLFLTSFFMRGHQDEPLLSVMILVISLVVALLIIAVLTVRYSGSPGNLLVNCQVVDASTGNPLTFKQAVHRSIGLYLTVASLGLGFLWALVDKNRQAIHDRLAKTVVISNGLIDRFDESQKSLHQLLSEVR